MTVDMPPEMATELSLCQYHKPPFTDEELRALRDYYVEAPKDAFTITDPVDIFEPSGEDAETRERVIVQALRDHAEQFRVWHDALVRLLNDPRLVPKGTYPPGAYTSRGEYSPAVAAFVRSAAGTYHRKRHRLEYLTTRWALGLTNYPDDSNTINVNTKSLSWG
ncbi:hypothetical protein [Streptomyces sp. Da 82-17]|uniref:hypothetical protein n=1 Tax=Streptomyces sp. Da 82-17 TaxID=3377116 RepID=UPI0038D40EC0